MNNLQNSIWLKFLLGLSRYVDSKVSCSGKHSVTVARWVHSITRIIDCDGLDPQTLYWAALLHDIGKVGVPDTVLSKAGPLNDQEWVTMRLHPTVGANIVKSFNSGSNIAPLVYAHQEKFDGSGYPRGLRGEEIPLGARILAVIDAFDAMTSDRVYRRAFSENEAIQELKRGNGKQFDPGVVDVFLHTIRKN